MSILLGMALVTATWIVAAAAIIAIGLLPAAFLARGNPSATVPMVIRQAIWWGLTITVIAVLALNMWLPVSAPVVGIALLAIALTSAITGILVLRGSQPKSKQQAHTNTSWTYWSLGAVLVIAQLFWAWTALGPVTNYDSGLYHLGAVAYATEYSAIPGIANLYPAFGYATAQFPLSAIFTHFGWGLESFRLINGFILFLVAVDLLMRVRRKTFTPGTYVLLVMVTMAWVALIALADYWVASPSQDTTAWLITAVATAYLVDALDASTDLTERRAVIAVTIALVTVLVLVRSTVAGFAVLVLFVLLWNFRSQIRTDARAWIPPIAVSGIVVAAGATVLLVRDYLLSGWLFFPLDLLPTGALWQAANPAATSQAILGYHRDPTEIWGATEGWAWIPGWLGRLPTQWEFWAAAVIWAVALALLVTQRQRVRSLRGAIVLSATPLAGATAIWFLATPPSPRFAWGLIFGLPAVLLGWALWAAREAQAAQPPKTVPKALSAKDASLTVPVAAIALVVAFSALFRVDSGNPREDFAWAGLGLAQIPLVPAPQAAVDQRTLASGLTVLVPAEGELCWTRFPLCSPSPDPRLELLGQDLADGLTVTGNR